MRTSRNPVAVTTIVVMTVPDAATNIVRLTSRPRRLPVEMSVPGHRTVPRDVCE